VPSVLRENPEVIYRFLTIRPNYEKLCQEVAYIIKHKLMEEGIEFSSITYRTKELNSFLEKLERKKYEDPFNEITDVAGVRVVCLYHSDLSKIEEIIRNEFDTVEKVDKYQENSSDRFGYMAVHFLVKLGDEYSGPRYDYLKKYPCEIQIRTVLQHAWALIDQHLVYKKQSQVPIDIRNEINELSKVLEEADQRFEQLRQKRVDYILSLEKAKTKERFMKMEINADSFKAFCELAFPEMNPEIKIRNFYLVLKWIDPDKYHNIGKLRDIVEKARPQLPRVVEMLENSNEPRGREDEYWTNLRMVHISMAIADPNYRETANLTQEFRDILEKADRKEQAGKKTA
ncbi:MAG: GTP pyrophosphokinase family protein, partial [Vulcanimicrobiota bacterium]